MGKKVNPIIFRMNQTRTWDSKWFSVRDFKKLLRQDIEIKKYMNGKLSQAFISKIVIERTAKSVNINITAGRPGVIIGRGGVGIEELKKEISRKFVKDIKMGVNIGIKEVTNPNLDAAIISQSVKLDIEKRMPFRRAMKQAIGKVEKARAKGVKVQVSGRLNGVEIARSEKLTSGNVPLHTLRADIDYAFCEANTIYGVIGIKVWIYKGDVFAKSKDDEKKDEESSKESKNNSNKVNI
ncbi:30S ribosomal protein S3 [Candidatus Falkowbacteria bacterium]|jgi:small subunit ribosomal protein S3|nr:30S ribosomal protein S3 [Candidatus Falkowbacteria bacterium]MBT7007140.1 30S ribosomal protein S3 [Candidatus Falkowbacteria bacterium]MBT7402611.1 30S ribosomal protein S3 [Candidatus Woesearchaeota archaeon]